MDPAGQIRERQQESAMQDESERDLWSGNYSARTMIAAWIGAGFATLVTPVAVALFAAGSGTVWLVILILLMLLWLWLAGTALFRKFNDHYWLTTQRLKHRSGILFRQSNRLELIDIDDVSFSQGPIQAIMGIGTIQIKSSDVSHPEFEMTGIAEVQQVADMIDDARRDERRKRGLHIEAV